MTKDLKAILPSLRPGIAADATLLEMREAFQAFGATQLIDPDARVTEAVIGEIACVIVEPPHARATMLYMHGGGFRVGEPATYIGLASRLAMRAGLRIVLAGYRLAPEHPYPAALHDVFSVYRTLAAQTGDEITSNAPLLGGDSAGGGLAAALALLACDMGIPSTGILLLSPWLDLTARGASFEACADSDEMFSREVALACADHYLAGQDPMQGYASPLHAQSLAGFPPLWVTVSGSEVLREDTVEFAGRLAREGGTVTMSVRPGLPHVWPVVLPDSYVTNDTIAEMADFVRNIAPL
ncbi:alpha/beta hydrolase [Rhizobium sp. TRM95796]|uniref:alpha/beta hydrolase n=1 Tax=Rhizobium sp. TRM95796 TaxID=2979862 RepID=UPI0021E87DC8|nr:alpha/beta hydrolase [Rhizobium sp. TRM95796]MCV3768860.1 alpha/beta hydrolase [Rhizobium sp. TRM95796]